MADDNAMNVEAEEREGDADQDTRTKKKKKKTPTSKKSAGKKAAAGSVHTAATIAAAKADKSDAAANSRKLMLAKLLDETDDVDSDDDTPRNVAGHEKAAVTTENEPTSSTATSPADQLIASSKPHPTPAAEPTLSITEPVSATLPSQRERESELVRQESVSRGAEASVNDGEQSKHPAATIKKERETESDRKKMSAGKNKKEETTKGKKATAAIDKEKEYKGMSREERRRLEQEKAKAALAPPSTTDAAAQSRIVQQHQRRMSNGQAAVPVKRDGLQKVGAPQLQQQRRDGKPELKDVRDKDRHAGARVAASTPPSSLDSSPALPPAARDTHGTAVDSLAIDVKTEVKHDSLEEQHRTEALKRDEKRVKIPKKEEKASKPIKPATTAAKSSPMKETRVDAKVKEQSSQQQKMQKETVRKVNNKRAVSGDSMDVDDEDELWKSDSEDNAATATRRGMNGLSPPRSPMSPSRVTSIPISASNIRSRSPPRSPPMSPSLEPPATILELMKNESPPSSAPPSPMQPTPVPTSQTHSAHSAPLPTAVTAPAQQSPVAPVTSSAPSTIESTPVIPAPAAPPRQAKTMNSSFWTDEELDALRSGVSQFGMDFDAVKKANPLLFKRRTPANLREKMSALMESD